MDLGVSIGERIADPAQIQRASIENATDNMRSAMPGKIIDFNEQKQTATVQPLIREFIRGQNLDLPQLLDVPCFFPRAGGYCLTFPVKPNDECLIIFNDMCIDGWWQSGGIQNQLETRRHDLSDACALLGITSAPNAVKDYSTTSVMLRNEDNDSYVEIVDDDKTINITGAEKINVTAVDDITVSTDKNVNVTAAETINITAASDITVSSNAAINISAQANVVINAQADITVNANGNAALTSQGNTTVTAQGSMNIKSQNAMTIQSDTSVTITTPNITTTF